MRCDRELDEIAVLLLKAREAAVRIQDNFLQYLIDMAVLHTGQSIAAGLSSTRCCSHLDELEAQASAAEAAARGIGLRSH